MSDSNSDYNNKKEILDTLDTLDTPDTSGWFFFKKTKKTPPVVVFVNDDGIGFAMDESGKTWEIQDSVGSWEAIEPENI